MVVEAKDSEVLKGTQTQIFCVITELEKKLDAVTWGKPLGGGNITNGIDGYQIVEGTYDADSSSQTTILTIPAAKNTGDSVYTCAIASLEQKVFLNKTVNSKVFSKYPYLRRVIVFLFIFTSLIDVDSSAKTEMNHICLTRDYN